MRTAWLATPGLRAVEIIILVTITVTGLSVSSWAAVCEGLDGGPGDLDGDGFGAAFDCDDTDPGVATPSSSVVGLRASAQPFLLSWSPPTDTGGSSPTVSYEVLRSARASDFLNDPSATCLDVNGQDQ